MALFQQRATYEALTAPLAALGLELMLGIPASMQRFPGAYLLSNQIAGPPRTFAFATLRPTLTLVVKYQDESAAEIELIDVVDLVANDLHGASLEGVCKCTLESVAYAWRPFGGIDYRVADLILVLSNS